MNSPYNLRSAKRTPVRLLGRACLIPQRGQKHSEAPGGVCHGNAMGMPCIIIELRGIASQVLWNARVRAMQVLWELIVLELWGYGKP